MKLHQVKIGDQFFYRRKLYRLNSVENNVFHCTEVVKNLCVGFCNMNMEVKQVIKLKFVWGPADGDDTIRLPYPCKLNDSMSQPIGHRYELESIDDKALVATYRYSGALK